jgi:hypothetical protein
VDPATGEFKKLFVDLPEEEQAALIKKRVKMYSQKASFGCCIDLVWLVVCFGPWTRCCCRTLGLNCVDSPLTVPACLNPAAHSHPARAQVYKKVHVEQLEDKTSTVCQRENSFYVDTVR